MARVNAARAEKLGISVDEVIRRDLSSTSLHCYIAPAHVAAMAHLPVLGTRQAQSAVSH